MASAHSRASRPPKKRSSTTRADRGDSVAEFIQRDVQSHEIQPVALIGFAGPTQFHGSASANRAFACGIHQHVAHHARHHGQELATRLPVDIADIFKPQIYFVDERRRLQGAASAFRVQIPRSHPVHFLI